MPGPDVEAQDQRHDAARPRPAGLRRRVARPKPGFLRALVKYGLVGGCGVLVNLTALHLLHIEFGFGFTRSSAIATELAIVTNYLGNELWTFHHRRLSLRRLGQFNLAALVTLVLTVTLATILKEFVHPLAAQLAGIAVGASVNFAVNFWWTWRR